MKKEDYLIFINEGKKYLNINDYCNAIMIFQQGLDETHNPIFNLYIGICYFKCSDYFTATTYLKIYESIGKEYLETCYLFLSAIYKENDDNINCYYYYQKFLGRDKIDNHKIPANGIIESYSKLINTKIEHTYKLIMSIN